MDVRDERISVRRDDCERACPLARSWVFPVLPNAAEAKRPTILHGDCVGLFGFLPLDCQPFEEPVHRNDAASRTVSISERRAGERDRRSAAEGISWSGHRPRTGGGRG